MFTLLIASMAASAIIGTGTTVRIFKALDNETTESDFNKVILDIDDSSTDDVNNAE